MLKTLTARRQVCDLVWSMRMRGYTREVLIGVKYAKIDGMKMDLEKAIDYLHEKLDEMSSFAVCFGGTIPRQS
ncbi:MAG: hypothetical protein ACFFD4_08030 [Candidatus Odinarchaeota archaeon]